MPTLREVHDTFQRLIAEQEAFASQLRDEAGNLGRSAAAAVEGVRGIIVDVVRSILVDEASLGQLAERGAPAPLERLQEMRATNARQLAEACRQLDDATAARPVSLLSERLQAAQAAQTRARAEAEALMLRMRPILPPLAADEDATIRKIAAHPAPTWLRRMTDRDTRRIHTAASLYAARLGHDLALDARAYVAQRDQETEQATLSRTIAKAADEERRRLDAVMQQARVDIAAVTSSAGQAAPFEAALACAEIVCLEQNGAIALRGLAGERLPALALAELVRADRLRALAGQLEQRAAAVLAFRDKLAPHMSKLRRGRGMAPSKAIAVDLADIEGKWAGMKAGLVSGREATAALQAADRALGTTWCDERSTRVEAAISRSRDDTWWNTIGLLYILNVMCERPDASPAAAMFPDLNPDALRAACEALAPDLAASLAACHVPGGSEPAPHTSITGSDASAHAAVAAPDITVDGHDAGAFAINIDASFAVDVPSLSVDMPDLSVHVPDISTSVSASSFDSGYSQSV